MHTSTIDSRLAQAKNLIASRQFEDGIQILKDLIRDNVEVDTAHLNIGAAYIQWGKPQEAIDYLDGCGSSRVEIQLNIAAAADSMGDEERGRKACLEILKSRQQQHAAPYRKLVAWATENKQWPIAYEALVLLFEMNSEDFFVCYKLGETCKEMQQHKKAVTYLLKAMELCEDEGMTTNIHGQLAGLYKDCGEQQKALHHFRETYRRSPSSDTCSNLIMDMQYTHGVTLKDFYTQCREYSERFLSGLPRYQFPRERLQADKAERGLRIGWVSGDFKTHSLTNLMIEQFKQFRTLAPRHEHYLYSAIPADQETSHSEEYKKATNSWKCIYGASDADAAKLIANDKIDVLVDLAGHTGYNRLRVFGYKPAPVQMGYISGMMTPPALETIHYFLTDPYIRPPSASEVCSETLLDLSSCCSYFPIGGSPDVAPLPADRNGFITFGSTNNPCKISKEVLIGWGNVLRNVQQSRMIIKVYTQGTETLIKRVMVGLGVSEDRLLFVRNLPSTTDVMRLLTEQVDVFLDTWPCAGMLTSAEALWMGCPVISMVGDTFLHRQSWTLLCQIDRKEWGAETLEGYVKAAADLVRDRKVLREARASLRERMNNAPMRKPEVLAAEMLRHIEWAWRDWCTSRDALWCTCA